MRKQGSILNLTEYSTAPATLDGRFNGKFLHGMALFASEFPLGDAEADSPSSELTGFSSPNEEEGIFRTSEQWRLYPPRWKHTLLSIGLHVLVVAAVLLVGMWRVEPFPGNTKLRLASIQLTEPNLARLLKTPSKGNNLQYGGGGGGGARTLTPTTRGRLPRPTPKQFRMPLANTNPRAELFIVPTILVGSDFRISDPALLSALGQPQAIPGPPSAGPGSGGGIGSGTGTGVGPGTGPGVGPGSGGGSGGGRRFVPGGGIVAPVLVSRVEPEYSRAAYDARLQGQVTLEVSIDTGGIVRVIRVVKGLGMGLDEKAAEAVNQWRFKPAQRDGQPYGISGMVEVYFRL